MFSTLLGVLHASRSEDCNDSLIITIWRFPEMVVRLKNPFYFRIFHEINHPAIGVPALFQTPIYKLYVETTLLFILQGFIQ